MVASGAGTHYNFAACFVQNEAGSLRSSASRLKVNRTVPLVCMRLGQVTDLPYDEIESLAAEEPPMRRSSRWILLSLVSATLGTTHCGQSFGQDEVQPVEIGQPAPNFTVSTDEEKFVELNDYLKQHKLVALVFVRAHW